MLGECYNFTNRKASSLHEGVNPLMILGFSTLPISFTSNATLTIPSTVYSSAGYCKWHLMKSTIPFFQDIRTL